MSDHSILLVCSTEGCETSEFIYTGAVFTDRFPDSGPDSFEGSIISTPCNEHTSPSPASPALRSETPTERTGRSEPSESRGSAAGGGS